MKSVEVLDKLRDYFLFYKKENLRFIIYYRAYVLLCNFLYTPKIVFSLTFFLCIPTDMFFEVITNHAIYSVHGFFFF